MKPVIKHVVVGICLIAFTLPFTMGFLSSLLGRTKPPAGYQWMLERNGGDHVGPLDDMHTVNELASRWAESWHSSLAFFASELDSLDASRIKTSMVCLTNLAVAVEHSDLSEASLVTADDRAEFTRRFPTHRLKQIMAAHPEYDDWVAYIRFTSFADQFPDPSE